MKAVVIFIEKKQKYQQMLLVELNLIDPKKIYTMTTKGSTKEAGIEKQVEYRKCINPAKRK